MPTLTVKEADGPGTLTDVEIAPYGRANDTASKPVVLSNQDKAVLDAMATALATLAGWNEAARGAINLIASQVGVAGNAGAAGANTIRVVQATDSPSQGGVAHDAGGTGKAPLLMGGYSSAAAPTPVDADGDAVRAWLLRNGAQAVVLTAGGALIPGDATNGIDVDVIRIGGQAPAFGSGANGATVLRVALATDSPGITPTINHGAADSDNATIKMGGQARTTNPTATTDGQRSHFIADKLGKQIAVSAIRELKGKQRTQIASSTTETTIVTAAASTFHDLYGLILSNTSASDVNVTIRENTAGAIVGVFPVKAGQMGGFMLAPGDAIPQGTVNNTWTAQCSASIANLEVTALFVKNT